MTPKMQEALFQLSLRHDPDPNVIFRHIVTCVAEAYEGTMAMLNLVDGTGITVREVINPHRIFSGVKKLPLDKTFCLLSIRTVRPLVIQDAARHPEVCNHPAIRLGLCRYLGVPIHNPHGEAIGTLCFLDNRTKEMLVEQDIRFLSLLAMRASAELEQERLLKERDEERRRFLAMMTHDLRQPLTALKTMLYLLQQEEPFVERTTTFQFIDEHIQNMSLLLDGMAEYNKITAGKGTLHTERADISKLIRKCVQGFAPVFQAEGLELACDLEMQMGEIVTDKSKLTHILLNLLSNALKFTPEGTVWVRTYGDGKDRWMLEVEDTGVGMSAADQENVFEEFHIGQAVARSEMHSTGLGLAIVSKLCEALQGRLCVQSQLNQGTRFSISFPRCLT